MEHRERDVTSEHRHNAQCTYILRDMTAVRAGKMRTYRGCKKQTATPENLTLSEHKQRDVRYMGCSLGRKNTHISKLQETDYGVMQAAHADRET